MLVVVEQRNSGAGACSDTMNLVVVPPVVVACIVFRVNLDA